MAQKARKPAKAVKKTGKPRKIASKTAKSKAGGRSAKPKQKDVRYIDIHKDGFDEAQFSDWVKQASALPGETM